ncbi:MAG TPA: NADH-quinone oxidoreductase subunit NuoF [Candidatus Udaeobacter sp.]|jgi:NADH-quinone oxidoreductase subunit F|nr:NADH-quinone oxidoreductase subunit NuoF [Candidatus Udaeobacter sp.]
MADSTNLSVPAELERKMDEAIRRYPSDHRRSAAMPLLHLWQEHFGSISDDAVLWIAEKLGLQPINILELVTFYPMYREQPPGKTHVRVCRTLSCAMAGGYELMEKLCATFDIRRPTHGDSMHNPISVSPDGNYSVEFVECLASCGTAPVCMVGEQLHENVDANSTANLLRNQTSNIRHQTSPHPLEHRLIYKNIGRADWTADIDCYLRDGGYEQLKQALALSRADIVNKVKNSGLRGRGGAGFSCGLKWSFIKPDEKRPVYLICNADESEPGTFKDRYIIHYDPHQLLEGILISCYALNARTAYIYIRGEFPEGAKILERAIEEARAHNFLGKNMLGSGFDAEVYIHRGAGAYICGEETGLIESLEGKRGYPRIKPPYFPAVLGLYMCPTIVNNVETLCHIKHIIAIGGAEYARLGRPNNTGTRIVCVSGDVQRPGYFEIEVGAVTMGQLIYEMAGGLRPGRKLKAVIPGGSSAKVLRADERFKLKQKQPDGATIERELSIEDIPMDFDSLTAAGSMAGSGGVIVLDDSRDMVWVLNNINEFYAHESCGQCTPCREGSLWMKKITDRILRGGGVVDDPKTLKTIGDNIAGRTICAFGEACAWPTQSFVEKFPEEFAARAKKATPPPLPPEYTPEELIEEDQIPTVPMAHDPGWEKAGARGTI